LTYVKGARFYVQASIRVILVGVGLVEIAHAIRLLQVRVKVQLQECNGWKKYQSLKRFFMKKVGGI
jgi:hypothetical protein